MKQEDNKINKSPQQKKPSVSVAASSASKSAAAKAETVSKNTEQHSGKKKWLLLLLVVFLFGTVLFVPAARIPGLSGLLARFGLSAEDVQNQSVGSALRMGWQNRDNSLFYAKGGNGGFEDIQTGRSSLEKQQVATQAGATSAGSSAESSNSDLFNLRAVNAYKRAHGQAADAMVGAVAYRPNEEEEATRAALQRTPRGWSAEAQEAQAQKNLQEVFFGADADLQTRTEIERENGVGNSADTAKMLAQSDIVGAAPVNLFAVPVGKAAGMREISLQKSPDKGKEQSTGLTKMSVGLSAGNKSERDLAYVWLYSSLGEEVKPLMLKKQLATGGYMAMSIPGKIYTADGKTSGSIFRPQEIAVAFEMEDKQLLSDEECREQVKIASEDIRDVLDNMATPKIKAMRKDIPLSCPKDLNDIQKWIANLGDAQNDTAVSKTLVGHCKTIDEIYKTMNKLCKIESPQRGLCAADKLQNYASDLTEKCGALEELLAKHDTQLDLLKTAEQNKKDADDYVASLQNEIEALNRDLDDNLRPALAAAQSAPEPDTALIEQLQAEITEKEGILKGKQEELAEVAIPQQTAANSAFGNKKKDFGEALFNYNDKFFEIYGKGGEDPNRRNKLKSAYQSMFGMCGEVSSTKHYAGVGLVDTVKREGVITSFNMVVDENDVEDAGKDFSQWNPFFSTMSGRVSSSDVDGKDVLIQLVEKHK